MPNHSRQTIQQVFEAFLQCRTVEGAANICDIPATTAHKWAKKYKWREQLQERDDELAEHPFEQNKELEQYVKRFDVPAEDATTLRQIKTLEGICFACMKREVSDEEIHLKPKNFKEAVEALKICWQARENLLHRDKKASVNISGPTKIDFITPHENSSTER